MFFIIISGVLNPWKKGGGCALLKNFLEGLLFVSMLVKY
jgi:hypothetical protein